MTTEQLKALIRRVPEEIYNQGNLAVVDQVFALDYIEHFPLPPGFPTGIQAVKTFVTAIRAAFPDFHYTIDDSIAEGDRVVFRLTARGTQTGEFMEVAATGKQATWQEIHICRVANGKIVEHWSVGEQLSMLQQLGALPMQS